MSKLARTIGLMAAVAMFFFSVYIYRQAGDWVAIVFALGSLAYGAFFFATLSNTEPTDPERKPEDEQ